MDFTSEISSVVGIPSGLLWAGLTLLIVMSAGIMSYRWTGSRFLCIAVMSCGTGVCAVMGFIPVWVGLMSFIGGSAYVLVGLYSTSGDDPVVADGDAGESYWVEYGNKIKLAYNSKFGGENPEFSRQVDQRITIMENNGRGFTRGLAKDWLRLMEKFTESRR